MSEKKLSVIMPAYNAERTIESSIRSVLSASSDCFELLIINDGSTDNTEKIIKSFADSRIKYIKKENSGVSDTRNYGLKNACGEYITFIDSDDCYTHSAIDKIIEYIEKYSADFLGFGFYGEHIRNNKVYKTEANSISQTLIFDLAEGAEAFQYIFESSHILLQTSWNKVLKREIMTKNGIEFNENQVCYENLTMLFDYLKHAEKAVFVDDILYKYNGYADISVPVLKKRKKLELTSDVSECYKRFIQLCEKFNYRTEYRNYMNEAFLKDYVFCSRKYFEKSDEYTKKQRFDAFCRFLYDENFLILKKDYLQYMKFYKVLYLLSDHGLKHIAYKLYEKKLIK